MAMEIPMTSSAEPDDDSGSPYAARRHRGRKLTEFVLNQGHRSQAEMLAHFRPLLQEQGQIRTKLVCCMARRARQGEVVVTVKGGRTTKREVVKDDVSMVVKSMEADHEEYILDGDTFRLNYEADGSSLDLTQGFNDVLERQGFKVHKSKRKIWSHQVTEEDMQFVPTGYFRASFDTLLQLSAGDFLATGYPESMSMDIYVIPAHTLAEQYSSIEEIDRSQEFMVKHFLPKIKQHGMVRRKVVGCMARPAQRGERLKISTREGGIAVGECVVNDNDSVVVKDSRGQEFAMGKRLFELDFEAEGCELDCQEPGNMHLSQKGFRMHQSQRKIWAHCVSAEDMKAIPSGLFWEKSPSNFPVPLKQGDFLAADYPEEMANDVFMIPAETLAETYEALPEDSTQEFMCEHFLPILREKGIVMKKTVGCMARPSRVGETITTVEGGIVVSQRKVEDARDMVLKALTGDREEYLLRRDMFELNYELDAKALDGSMQGHDYLVSKGFKLYRSKRRILAYTVERKDLELLPTGFFWTAFGSSPVKLKRGDVLVTGYPEENAKEVYSIPSHILQQTYARASDTLAPLVPSWYQNSVFEESLPTQEHLILTFGPVLLDRGSMYRKTVTSFIRPAEEGEEIVTLFEGKVETVNTARRGDWIVRARTTHKERYILSPERFAEAYDAESGCVVHDVEDAESLNAEGFKEFRPKTRIVALQVSEEDLVRHFPSGRFVAPWNEPMLVEVGDYIAGKPSSENLEDGIKEVYRIEKSAFAQTYSQCS
eukprot:TRINITY_DN79938_c0_g1_i1.p1 TRINITY_DN79938_c0_g1~~TRINITY_DN79938_c0_g1_i1.p1  ORF type:complete len:797 (+),score=144.47 TRINITY_DN79938_c0_g1_i1:86-2392(+)